MPSENNYHPKLLNIGRVKTGRHRLSNLSQNYYNRSVQAFASSRGTRSSSAPLTVTNYWNANIQGAYGNTGEQKALLGDLFNDIMGSVVPGWDTRPDALKKLKVNIDPRKLVKTVQGVMSPEKARQYAEAMNNAGVNPQYGGVDLTANRIGFAYENAGIGAALSEVPVWAWAAGAGVVGLFFFMKRGR
jgi:hypothetical protein